jgi:hypothetical protein
VPGQQFHSLLCLLAPLGGLGGPGPPSQRLLTLCSRSTAAAARLLSPIMLQLLDCTMHDA